MLRRDKLLTVLFLFMMSSCASAVWPDLEGRDLARQNALRPLLERVPKVHPRIFIQEGDLPVLRQRIAEDERLRRTYNWMLRWAKGFQYHTNLWIVDHQLRALLLVYMVEGRDPVLRGRCLEIMDYLASRVVGSGNDKLNSWTVPIAARGLAIGYDWLYSDISPEQRRIYGQEAIDTAKMQYNLGTYRHSDYNNHLYMEYGPVSYVGIALHDDGIDNESAEQLALDGLELLTDHFLPVRNQVGEGGGGWHEGMYYHAFFAHEFAHQFELWSNMFRNSWEAVPGIQGEASWLVYSTRPFDSSRVAIADIDAPSQAGWQIAYYLPLVQRHYRDGVAGTLLDNLRSESMLKGGAPYYWWPYVLWWDPSVNDTDIMTLPLSRIFGGLGWASMRSDWTKNATYALFVSGDYYSGHQHMDQNSFVIHKFAPLAIDAGGYGAKGTEYHNTVLIGKGQRSYRNDPRRYYAPIEQNSEFDTGTIVSSASNEHFVYVAGEATNAHGEFRFGKRLDRPVNLALRQFLFLRPDLFVVFDRVKTTRRETPVSWLLHSHNQPKIDGNLVTITNGEGRLFSRTLLPSNPQVVTEVQVGGSSKREDYLVRIESPSGLDHQFLHVLFTADSKAQHMPKLALMRDSGRVGVKIEQDGRVWMVYFNSTNELGGELRIWDDVLGVGRTELYEKEVLSLFKF